MNKLIVITGLTLTTFFFACSSENTHHEHGDHSHEHGDHNHEHGSHDHHDDTHNHEHHQQEEFTISEDSIVH